MGCCHSRKHCSDGGDSSVAPKSKKPAPGNHLAAKPMLSNPIPNSPPLSLDAQPRDSADEAEEHLKRLAERDRLEEQRRQNELNRLKENGGFISYHQSTPGMSTLTESSDKPIMELKVMPHSAENVKPQLGDPSTEQLQSEPKKLPLDEDDAVFSEAEETTTNAKGEAPPLVRPPPACPSSPKGPNLKQPLNSSTPIPAALAAPNELAIKGSDSDSENSEKDIIKSTPSGGNGEVVVVESKHVDPVKKTDPLSFSKGGMSLNTLDGMLSESRRGRSTAIVEEVQSPGEQQQQQPLSRSVENSPNEKAGDAAHPLYGSKILMKKMPPPPSPSPAREEKFAQEEPQVGKNGTKEIKETQSVVALMQEKTPLSLEDPKSSSMRSCEGDELADVSALQKEREGMPNVLLGQVAAVLPTVQEKEVNTGTIDYLLGISGDVARNTSASRSGGDDGLLSFLSFGAGEPGRSAVRTEEKEGKLLSPENVTGVEKHIDPTNVQNHEIVDPLYKESHHVGGEDATPAITLRSGVVTASANSPRGEKERRRDSSDHHTSPSATVPVPVQAFPYQPASSSGSSLAASVKDVAWFSISEADTNMFSRETINDKEFTEVKQAVETDRSAEVQPFPLQPNLASLPVIEEGILRRDPLETQHTSAPKQKTSLDDKNAEADADVEMTSSVQRPLLPSKVSSPPSPTYIDAADSNEEK